MSKMKFYITFTKGSAFYGCILPVWAENRDQLKRLARIEFDGRDIDCLYNEQKGRTVMENRGLVLMDEMGVAG